MYQVACNIGVRRKPRVEPATRKLEIEAVRVSTPREELERGHRKYRCDTPIIEMQANCSILDRDVIQNFNCDLIASGGDIEQSPQSQNAEVRSIVEVRCPRGGKRG